MKIEIKNELIKRLRANPTEVMQSVYMGGYPTNSIFAILLDILEEKYPEFHPVFYTSTSQKPRPNPVFEEIRRLIGQNQIDFFTPSHVPWVADNKQTKESREKDGIRYIRNPEPIKNNKTLYMMVGEEYGYIADVLERDLNEGDEYEGQMESPKNLHEITPPLPGTCPCTSAFDDAISMLHACSNKEELNTAFSAYPEYEDDMVFLQTYCDLEVKFASSKEPELTDDDVNDLPW